MAIEKYLNSRFKELDLPGLSCSIVYQNNVTTYNFGVSDLETSVAVGDNTIFNIASVGKLITTVCIFSLIEKGEFTLDTPLGDLLHDIPDAWRHVKVSHLLTHSSGIKNYTSSAEYWNEYHLDVSKARIIGYVGGSELEFKPGTEWSYTNTGFFLLGLIIEKFSGMDYFRYASQLIAAYNPDLIIVQTDDRKDIPGRAMGYLYRDGALNAPPYYSNSGTFSAGGFSVKPADFMDFENALFNGKILGSDSLDLITQPFVKAAGSLLGSPDPASDFKMTHGLFRFDTSGKVVLAHGGEIFGYRSEYMRVVDDNFAALLVTNSDRKFDGLEILRRVHDLTLANSKFK